MPGGLGGKIRRRTRRQPLGKLLDDRLIKGNRPRLRGSMQEILIDVGDELGIARRAWRISMGGVVGIFRRREKPLRQRTHGQALIGMHLGFVISEPRHVGLAAEDGAIEFRNIAGGDWPRHGRGLGDDFGDVVELQGRDARQQGIGRRRLNRDLQRQGTRGNGISARIA